MGLSKLTFLSLSFLFWVVEMIVLAPEAVLWASVKMIMHVPCLTKCFSQSLNLMHVRVLYQAGLRLHILELVEMPDPTPSWSTRLPLLKPAIFSPLCPNHMHPHSDAAALGMLSKSQPAGQSSLVLSVRLFNVTYQCPGIKDNITQDVFLEYYLGGNLFGRFHALLYISCVSCLEYRVGIHLY